MFKNMKIYAVIGGFNLGSDELQEAIQKNLFTPCLSHDMFSIGFGSPTGFDGEDVLTSNGCYLFSVTRQERILPGSVIKEELNELIKNIQLRENRVVRSKERKELRDDVEKKLIPQAFKKTEHINAYIDTRNSWLIINTTSEKRADEVLSLLRKTIGTLRIVRILLTRHPSYVLTQWVDSGVTGGFCIDNAVCNLVEADEAVNCKNMTPTSQEIHNHLLTGKQVVKLSMRWNQYSFVIDEDLSLSKIKVMDKEDDQPTTSINEDFTLMVLEATPLINALIAACDGEDKKTYQLMFGEL